MKIEYIEHLMVRKLFWSEAIGIESTSPITPLSVNCNMLSRSV